MSLQAVQTVIGKAAVDRAFRDVLFSKPDEALAGFDLSADEVASLKKLSREKFDAVAGELEEKILAEAVGGGATYVYNNQPAPAIQQFDLSRFGYYANTN
jgi:hypothetical protein